jgi:hypothetical protein
LSPQRRTGYGAFGKTYSVENDPNPTLRRMRHCDAA